jgi:hypothetical protein
MPEELNASPVSPIPRRLLGGTGQSVTIFGLGGEGVLRTHGREAEAVALIHRALEQGVNYFETAPAYASSMDYYGLALGEHRSQVFLASKTLTMAGFQSLIRVLQPIVLESRMILCSLRSRRLPMAEVIVMSKKKESSVDGQLIDGTR